jgi:hypothetical protein
LKPPASGALPVAAQKVLPGTYPAGSRLPDREAFGGFSPCTNYPLDLGEKDWGVKGAVSVVAFSEEPVAYFKHRGFALRVVNRTGAVAPFAACDSCLYLVREAVDADGRWRPIELPPEPICGNSFHRVFLEPDQYWQFPARLYSGPIKTRMRFRLERGGEQMRGNPIYSNEFEGQVVAAQFKDGVVVGQAHGTPRQSPGQRPAGLVASLDR